MRLLLVIWILTVSLTTTTAAAVDVEASITSSASNAATMINAESIIADGEAGKEKSKKKTPPNEIVRHRIGQRRKTPLMDVIETDTNNINNRKEIVRAKKENFASGTSVFLGIQKDGGSQHDDDDGKKKQQHLSDNRDTIGQVVVVHDDNNNNNNEYYYNPVLGKLNDEVKKNQMDVVAANEEEVSTVMMRMMLEESSVSGTLSMGLRLADFSLSMDLDTDDSIKVEPLTLTLPASSTSDADGVVEPALDIADEVAGKDGGTTVTIDPSSPAATPTSSSGSVDNANGSSPSSEASQPSSPTGTNANGDNASDDPKSPASDPAAAPSEGLVPTNTVTINEGPATTTTDGTTIGLQPPSIETLAPTPVVGIGVSTDGGPTTDGDPTTGRDVSASRRTIGTTYYHPLLVNTIFLGTIITLGVFYLF